MTHASLWVHGFPLSCPDETVLSMHTLLVDEQGCKLYEADVSNPIPTFGSAHRLGGMYRAQVSRHFFVVYPMTAEFRDICCNITVLLKWLREFQLHVHAHSMGGLVCASVLPACALLLRSLTVHDCPWSGLICPECTVSPGAHWIFHGMAVAQQCFEATAWSGVETIEFTKVLGDDVTLQSLVGNLLELNAVVFCLQPAHYFHQVCSSSPSV